ncbi:MAG: right-handed parallel beta-helix repeat-containing protein [Treponema sp.]|nr:right-handed parallel beta-helix repeat-containing protein [Treponema sp.]
MGKIIKPGAVLLLTLCLVHAACSFLNDNTASMDAGNPEPLKDCGAALDFSTYEAEDGNFAGELLNKNFTYYEIQTEASGRKAVKLTNTGDWVEFTLVKPANAMALRYCMADAPGGGGTDGSLAVYREGAKIADISLTSKYAWVYGEYPWTNDPAAGKGRRFFDESRILFGAELPAGTVVRLLKEDAAAFYIVDSADFELAAEPLVMPGNFLSIADYGAKAQSGFNNKTALANCIIAARSQNKGVWIPEGVFEIHNGPVAVNSGLAIQGAGMWYSTLSGPGAAFKLNGGGNYHFADFALFGDTTVRQDSAPETGFDGNPGRGSKIQRVWMEHLKVGVWAIGADNLFVENCRIRNTFADGLNLNAASKNSVVSNCHFRNTGDDSIAIWSQDGSACTGNIIKSNTIQSPWLASGIAVYGGGDNTIEKNIVCDTIAFGGGINISTNHGAANFSGSTRIINNILYRAGSRESNWNYDRGAVWFWAESKNIEGVEISGLEMYDSGNEGITFESGGGKIISAVFRNITIQGAETYGIHARSGTKGSVTMNSVFVSGTKLTGLRNEAGGQFIITKGIGCTGW